MCVNNLPKVVTRQFPGAESNLRFLVKFYFSPLQHIRISLLS